MKVTLLKSLKIVLVFLSCMLLRFVGQAQTAATMTMQNAIQTAPNIFEFDIWLVNTGTTTLALRGYSAGINYLTGMTNGGTLTMAYLNRDASLATLPVPTVNAATAGHLRLTTTTAVAGNEVTLTAGLPVRLATVRITNSVNYPADFYPGFNLQVTTVAGRTQCIATCFVSNPPTTPVNLSLYGTTNPTTATNLPALTGVVNVPCFFLNPSSTYTASNTTTTPVVCFGANTGTAAISISGLGSAVPTPVAGTYKIDTDTTNIAYTGASFTAANLSAGTHTIFVKSNYGCTDTAIALINGPGAALSSSFAASGCDSYTLPWSTVVTATGVYTHTYTTANACDSIVTATITINTSTTSSQTVSASGSYTWAANNVTYTVSGTYVATLLNAANCDSTATLILTISGANFTLSVIEDQPISCFGSNDGAILATASGPGTYTYSIDGGAFSNTSGSFSGITPGTHTVCATDGSNTLCDTINFVQPTALTLTLSIDSLVSCLGNDGQISASINGGTNVLQPYLTTWTNSSNVNLSPTDNFATSIDSLPTGMYYLTVEDDHACMISDSILLGSLPSIVVTASNTPIACNGGTSVISASATGGSGSLTLTIGGQPIAASYPAGSYTVTATDTKGCTGVSVLNITQPNALSSSSTISNCTSYTWSANNTAYTNSGVYSVTLLNASNCDSIVTLNLTIKNASINPPTTVSACLSYTWSVNGITYTTSGIKTATYLNAAGCDSSYVLNLTINQNTTITSTVTASNIYLWPVNGQTYTLSGVYTHTSIGSNGCLQTNILNLTINIIGFTMDVTIDQEISCFGNNDGSIQATAVGTGPFTYILDGGVLANNTGFFNNLTPGTHFVCAIAGVSIACDTIFLVEPPPLAASFFIDSMVSCHGNDGMMSINISGGTNILQGYLTWWTNAAGDTLNDILSNNFALDMDSLPVGPYTVHIEDDHGCFFAATGNMIAAPPIVVSATYNPIICFGGSTVIFPSGTGGVSYPTAYASTLSYTINGTAVAVPGPGYPAGPGTYTIIATDYKNCADTEIITITAPLAPITTTINVTNCNMYLWTANNTTYTNSGVYTATLTASNGCDSIVTMNLTINLSTINPPVNAVACNTYTWSINGLTYTNSGTYTASFLNSVGCDSNKTLNLIINQSSNNAPSNIQACNSYTWSVNGLVYTNSGTYVATFLNAAGCDSSHTLNLTINSSSVNTPLNVTACNTYTWASNNITYTSSGTYTASFLNAGGCDSIKTLNLVINSSTTNSPTTTTVCNTFTWPVNGTTYTSSGTYIATFLNASGCDSSHTLNLTVNTSTINAPFNITACNSYTWPANGFIYTSSGTYTYTYLNLTGCVSTHTLNLTINHDSIGAPVPVNACNSYTWADNGLTYTSSGSYTYTYLNVFGCNSSKTIQLTINTATVNAPENVTSCNSYFWAANSNTYTSSGTYTSSFLNANGCDSNRTLNLVINTNPDITNTTAGNGSSIAGSGCETFNQTDGSTHTYADASCRAIVAIQDAVGGNSLGSVSACAVVLPAPPVYNTQPYFARYFTVSATSSGPANLTLFLTQDDFNDYNANAGAFPQIPVPANPVNGDTTHLCVSQVPQTTLPGAPGALTTVHSVTAVWNAALARWEITFPVSGFSGFYCHACNPGLVPLPATITNFSGRKENGKDILEWTTSSEQNNAFFNLEYSTDGSNFSHLAKVNTKAINGNSTVNINYNAENTKPLAGHNYYRLQQVDIDGVASYESHVVDLIWGSNGSSVSIYPNPASNVVNIDLYSEKVSNTTVKILDMSGRVVKQIMSKSYSGMNSLSISLTDLAQGVYTIQIFENDKLSFVEKLNKNN